MHCISIGLIVCAVLLGAIVQEGNCRSSAREKRAVAEIGNCALETDTLNDIRGILTAINVSREISNAEKTKIDQKLTQYESSNDECKKMIWKILDAIREVLLAQNSNLTISEKTKDLEIKFAKLLADYDTLKRRVEQGFENELGQQKEILQTIIQENRNLQMAIRLIKKHIEDGESIAAAKELENLESRDAIVGQLLEEAYDGQKNRLSNVVAFIINIRFFTAGFYAYKALYEAMKKHNHASEKEVFLIYYRIIRMIDDVNFENQTEAAVKNEYFSLRDEIYPTKQSLLLSLANEIGRKNSRIEEINQIVKKTNYLSLPSYYAPELVKAYYSADLRKLSPLLKWVDFLPTLSSLCNSLEAILKELERLGEENSFEAWQVWIFTKYVLFDREEGDLSSTSGSEKCNEIFGKPPASKQMYMDEYVSKIRSKDFTTLKTWQTDFYRMGCILPDIIQSLSRNLFEDSIVLLFQWVHNMPNIEDKCVALDAFHTKLNEYSLINSHQHFLNLFVTKYVTLSSNYQKMPSKFQAKCARAINEDRPEVFKKLLWEDTSDCKLINKKYDEPLYMASSVDNYELRTWVAKTKDNKDQDWKIKIISRGLATFTNEYRDSQLYSDTSSTGHKLRIHAADDRHIKIQGFTSGDYLSANSDSCGNGNRCVSWEGYSPDYGDWRLEC